MKTRTLPFILPWSRSMVPMVAALLAWFSAAGPAHSENISPKSIRPERELFITAPAVLDSEAARYPGAWSFGTLVTELVGKENASACVADWLATFSQSQSVNDQVVMPRAHIGALVIEPWQKRDGYDPKSGAPWQPNLANAPFRLLAIVNRMDLCAPDLANTFQNVAAAWRNQGHEADFSRLTQPAGLRMLQVPGYGGGTPNPSSFGEGRLVFGATDGQGHPLPGDWTVIFEYRLASASGRGPREWAMSWHGLALYDVNDPRFAAALEEVTRSFTQRANNCAEPLAQLRSSEAAFGTDREFRQFTLVQGRFQPAPLTQTPAPPFADRHGRDRDLLAAFLHERDTLIRNGVHNLPVSLPARSGTVSLLAGSAFIPAADPAFHWELGRALTPEARRIYSLNTCNGCHAGETGCRDGLHVHPREAGVASRLSEFLRTDQQPLWVTDPTLHSGKVEYREMEDRATIFAALLDGKERDRLAELQEVLRRRLLRVH